VNPFGQTITVTLRRSAEGRASKGDGPEIPGRPSFEARRYAPRTSG